MTVLIIITVLNTVAIAVSFYLLYPPSNRSRAYTTSLEREKSNWKINEEALKGKCRLLESQNSTLSGAVTGLKLDNEHLQNQIDELKVQLLASRNQLIAAGVIHG